MQPEVFPQPTTEKEREIYGNAIEYGYQSADELLKRAMDLCDENTVLIVASSMGQKPFITIRKRQTNRAASSLIISRNLGLKDRLNFSTMSDQFNIYPNSDETKQIVKRKLSTAYIDEPERPMFYVSELDDFITVNLTHYDEISEDSQCHFPNNEENKIFRYEDLVYQTGHSKSGCHDPQGMLIIYGGGIRRGGKIEDVNNLDIAPTLLTILGLPVPPEMKGRVLSEAFA